MAFCTNCGTQIADDSRFCTNCGQPFAGTPQPSAPLISEPASYQAASAQPPYAYGEPAGYAAPQPDIYAAGYSAPAASQSSGTVPPDPYFQSYAGSGQPSYAAPLPLPGGGYQPPAPPPPAPEASYFPPAPAPKSSSTPLQYQIEGHNLQIARVQLQPGQEVYAEAGKMVYKTGAVNWETRMTGSSVSEKLLGALKRRLMGESIMMTYFHTDQFAGEVGFAGLYPGKIQVFELAAGQSILVQRDAFLFAESSIEIDIALVKKLGVGFLGGEGFILERLTGPGTVFIHAGGDFVDFNLARGETLQVQTGHLVAFEPTVDYDIQMVGNIRAALFGGEGIFLATLTGPGRVIVQSLTLERLRRELSPQGKGGDEHNAFGSLGGGIGGVVGGLGSISGSDD